MADILKKYGVKCLLFALLSMGFAPSLSAQDDLDLAEYYYSEGQFEQAKLYFEKIYKTNRTNRVYTNYLNTLIALNDFEESEKLVKKRIKTDNEDGLAYVQLGDLYKRFNKPEGADEQFKEALNKCVPTRSNIIRLANEYARIGEYEWALKTYEKGKTKSGDGYPYTYEIANMQGNLGDFDAMIESFLDLVQQEPNYLQTVQNSLNRTLNFEENPQHLEMLKSKLLRRSQKYPEAVIFNEMLTWLFLQKKDFASAYVQATALDKRQNESGVRVLNLADLAAGNKDYSTAVKAYQYVIDKGKNGPYYLTARMAKLRVLTTQLEEKPGLDKIAYAQLASEYKATLNDLGKSAETAGMLKDLAHIQAFYLDKQDSAIALLREAIALPGIYNKVQAACKLELGDILVFNNDVWDASLLFSQVELDFKEDQLGHEAKFRNARISYYTGDFEWAQGQLDVLKASTSKLISNDAIDLSLLITDNFNMDTITAPMEMFARADLLAYQNKIEQAFVTLDSLLAEYPAHSLTDEVFMLKANTFFRLGQFEEAKKLFERVIEFHFKDITADDALFKLAEMNERIFNDQAKAMELYEKLIVDYPGSLYIVEARKRFRALRGDAVN